MDLRKANYEQVVKWQKNVNNLIKVYNHIITLPPRLRNKASMTMLGKPISHLEETIEASKDYVEKPAWSIMDTAA